MKIKVTPSNSLGKKVRLNSGESISLRNEVNVIQSVNDIPDVEIIQEETGTTLVYNAETGNYELRRLSLGDVDANLDGGEF